ncbi:MAG TPA: MEDS domain-containing protein [Candidatus Dormibacteraeota bacterium]|nr:MEDS domain-containing protein [Candidatus Dormibacteraeota bacterium]
MKWLSTRQAAKSLGVSEASVRRWSDQGLLPVQRVGPRRVRRFDPEHLEGAPRSARGAQPAPRPRHAQMLLGGTPVDVPVHLAAFYDSDEGRVRLTAPFLADGILAGQPCFLLAQGEELQAYMDALDRVPGVDLDSALNRGDLTVVGAPGRTVAEALEYWEKNLWSAMDRHVSLVRAVGEMVSEREHFESEHEMLVYEATFNLTARRFPCAVICQYDVRKFSGPTILAALRAHPDILNVSLSLLLK